MKTPPSLNYVAGQWRDFLSNVPVETEVDITRHVPGTYSLYSLTIDLCGAKINKFYYLGITGRENPLARLSEHKSEITRCKCTTFNGKSFMYDPNHMAGLQKIGITFQVLEGGLIENDAKERERLVSEEFRRQYGSYVLTNPVGKKKC